MIIYTYNKIEEAVNSYENRINSGESLEAKFYEHQPKLTDDYNSPERIKYDNYKIILFSAYDSDSKNY